MKCPNCNIDLLMTERLGEQIDYCSKCRGIWLEKGKFEKFFENSSNHEKSHGEINHDYRKNNKKEGFLGNLLDF